PSTTHTRPSASSRASYAARSTRSPTYGGGDRANPDEDGRSSCRASAGNPERGARTTVVLRLPRGRPGRRQDTRADAPAREGRPAEPPREGRPRVTSPTSAPPGPVEVASRGWAWAMIGAPC